MIRRLIRALLPADWPARSSLLLAAAHVDAAHGRRALDVVLRSWCVWRAGGPLPRARWLGDLVLGLQEFLSGGLEPRRARIRGVADVFAGVQCATCGWHLRTASAGRCPVCPDQVPERAEGPGCPRIDDRRGAAPFGQAATAAGQGSALGGAHGPGGRRVLPGADFRDAGSGPPGLCELVGGFWS